MVLNTEFKKPITYYTNNTETIEILDIVFSVFGTTGGLTLALCLVPQIVKVIRTKSANDLSYIWLSLSMFGFLQFLSYAVYNMLVPVLITINIEMGLMITLIVLKAYYTNCYKEKKLKNIEMIEKK